MKDKKYFLLQNDKEIISVNFLENNEVRETKTYSINKKSIWATDGIEYLTILDTVTKTLEIINFITQEKVEQLVPYEMKPKSILINNDSVFIGGQMQKEMLIQFNLHEKQWYSLEIPENIKYDGKAIDDIIADDEQLMAIDNVVIPKYLLFYKLNKTDKAQYTHLLELPLNGIFKDIAQGWVSDNYLAVLSATYSDYGDFEEIAIYPKNDLNRYFVINEEITERNYIKSSCFAITGNMLIIANKEKGLGLFEIKDSLFKNTESYKFFNVDEEAEILKINYKQFKGKKIIKITVIPNTNKIVLTFKNWKNVLTHKFLEIL